MTRQRNDNHSTPFGLWLRNQERIDSKKGYTATNIDYLWRSYLTDKYLLIEEKRFLGKLPFWQKRSYMIIDRILRRFDPANYLGFYFIQFENSDPSDGKMYINNKESTTEDLFKLLETVNE